jgi:hypothetical protein
LRLGRLEVLLVLLVVCAAVYMGIQYFPSGGPNLCAPVPLSPEVKAYIDQKMAAGGNNAQCGDIPAVLARVTDVEAKMSSLDKFEELRAGLAQQSGQVNMAIAATRRAQGDALSQARSSELGRLRNEMATMCAGITVRSAAPGANPGLAPNGQGRRRGPSPGPGGVGRGTGPAPGQRRGGAAPPQAPPAAGESSGAASDGAGAVEN